MTERDEQGGYQVVVLTKRLPGGIHSPRPLRKLLSFLSEEPNAVIGDSLGMPLEEAEDIAQGETRQVYVDGHGKLKSSRGIVVRVS